MSNLLLLSECQLAPVRKAGDVTPPPDRCTPVGDC
jgi:hypothetical protein